MDIGILGQGSHVPERVVDNVEVSQWCDAAPGWIEERTGIRERRYAANDIATSDLAVEAARAALASAGVGVEDLTAIIVATSTPDHPQPSTASIVQAHLGAAPVPAFDLNAVCSGFLYGLVVGRALCRDAGDAARVLVIGADTFSRIMDRSDRRSVSLFGDGAGAVVLGGVPDGYGLRSSTLVADGHLHDLVKVRAGGSREPLTTDGVATGADRFRMDGRAVKDYALSTLSSMTKKVLHDADLEIDDIDRFVFHQANVRLLQSFAAMHGIDPDRMSLSAPEHGNTAAACIPLTLDLETRRRPLRDGERLLLASVGGGMTAGAAIHVWHDPHRK